MITCKAHGSLLRDHSEADPHMLRDIWTLVAPRTQRFQVVEPWMNSIDVQYSLLFSSLAPMFPSVNITHSTCRVICIIRTLGLLKRLFNFTYSY